MKAHIAKETPRKESVSTENDNGSEQASLRGAMAATLIGDGLIGNKQSNQRSICAGCNRPTPTSCFCVALPAQRIHLERSHCLVLQHPHEARRKNRSLPFVQHCLDSDSLTVHVRKRLSKNTDQTVKDLLYRPPEEANERSNVWLVYPGEEAVSLTEALEQRRDDNSRITLVFLDATWKYAKEMDRYNIQHQQYPANMLRVQLAEQDLAPLLTRPCRFDIRTPPTEQHLSTAECVAWVMAQAEERPDIYSIIMKPLDLMVQQWHSCKETRTTNDD